MSNPGTARGAELEKVPPEEAKRIEHIADLTVKQLESRYGAGKKFLRGVHPKDHGCVEATRFNRSQSRHVVSGRH